MVKLHIMKILMVRPKVIPNNLDLITMHSHLMTPNNFLLLFFQLSAEDLKDYEECGLKGKKIVSGPLLF